MTNDRREPPNTALEPTTVGAAGSAVAVDINGLAWLNFLR